jgi:sulfite reductase alpha subunit-like flavoprotein
VYTNDKGEIVKGVCSNFLCKDAAYSSEKKKYIKKIILCLPNSKETLPIFLVFNVVYEEQIAIAEKA